MKAQLLGGSNWLLRIGVFSFIAGVQVAVSAEFGMLTRDSSLGFTAVAFFPLPFIMYMLEAWTRADEWRLHLPITARDLFLSRLGTIGLRLLVAAVSFAFPILLRRTAPFVTLTSGIVTAIFIVLSLLLLGWLPARNRPFWGPAVAAIPVACLFAGCLYWLEPRHIPAWAPVASAAAFGGLFLIHYLRPPISFLIARDEVTEAPRARTAGSTNYWWALYKANRDWLIMIPLGLLFGATHAWMGPMGVGYAMIASSMFINPPKLSIPLPLSRRISFAYRVVPFVALSLIGCLASHIVAPSPLAMRWKSKSSFGHAASGDEYEKIAEQRLWPTPFAIMPCPSRGKYSKDPEVVRAELVRCQGMPPSVDVRPYMGIHFVDWERFWKDHPATPLDFSIRTAETLLTMTGMLLAICTALALRIVFRGRSLVRTVGMAAGLVLMVPYLLSSLVPLAWHLLGELHERGSASGVTQLGEAITTAVAESLPADPILSTALTLAIVAALYLAAQELEARCDAV